MHETTKGSGMDDLIAIGYKDETIAGTGREISGGGTFLGTFWGFLFGGAALSEEDEKAVRKSAQRRGDRVSGRAG